MDKLTCKLSFNKILMEKQMSLYAKVVILNSYNSDGLNCIHLNFLKCIMKWLDQYLLKPYSIWNVFFY